MNDRKTTFDLEDAYFAPFFKRTRISIDRGQGVYVYDEEGSRFIDFTAGWGVTCIGHAHPVIIGALAAQASKIMQNPEAGKTYSPARAKLLELFSQILPHNLKRVFFCNSGAEANDAAIKLARKASGKKNVIATHMGFHGRTISTASATGQASHRDKYNPLMPNYIFVPFDDVDAVERIIDDDAAAVIVEPIQGEGGIHIPSDDYLKRLSYLCSSHGVYLILDEIQTGFCRTGPLFCSGMEDLKVDFMTMAKGIAGGFPFSAFAMTEEVTARLSIGDHGGTYAGNPLGCAVSYAVINYLIDNDISGNVSRIGSSVVSTLKEWKKRFPAHIIDIRGRGLLIAIEMKDEPTAAAIQQECLAGGLIMNVTHGTILRIFPALNITADEAGEGLAILKRAMERICS